MKTIKATQAIWQHPQTLTASIRSWALLWPVLLVTATLLKGVLWAFLVYPFDAPDEPSHFIHIMQIREYGTWLPVTAVSDTEVLTVAPATTIDAATAALISQFGYSGFKASSYESSQPPLYYWAAAILTAPLGDDRLTLLYACRLVAVLFGTASVVLAWWALSRLWSVHSPIVWGVPLLLTLLPQFSFITAVISNDVALVFSCTLLFAVWSAGLRAHIESPKQIALWGLAAGCVTGLVVLSKLTAAISLPATFLWLWWLAGKQSRVWTMQVRLSAIGLLAIGGGLLAVSGWWLAYNLITYGEPTGTAALFELYRYQNLYLFKPDPWPVGATRPLMVMLIIFRTLHSFFGVYGWINVWAPLAFYAVPSIALVLALVGVWRTMRQRDKANSEELHNARTRLSWLSVIVLLASIASLLYFNFFIAYQPQGRYLFIALVPMLLLIWVGLTYTSPWSRLNKLLLVVFLCSLALLNIASVIVLLEHVPDLAYI